MMLRKETIRNILIIAGVFFFIGILGGFVSGILVSGIQDPGLRETAGTFLHYAGWGLIMVLGLKLLSQYYTKPLIQ